MEFPLSPIEKILKRTRLKVSKDAVKEFAVFLEEITADISAEAAVNARRKGKKTVQIEDVREAIKRLGI